MMAKVIEAYQRATSANPSPRSAPTAPSCSSSIGIDPPPRSSRGAAQPPATAGMMLTVSPSGTGVSRPSRKRTSSSATKTLTKRRRPPSSSSSRSAKPGWAASRLVKHLADGGALDRDLGRARR